MSKTGLRSRPMFYRTLDAIEALTVVFTALAVARFMQETTGVLEEDRHHAAASA